MSKLDFWRHINDRSNNAPIKLVVSVCLFVSIKEIEDPLNR